MPAAWVYNTEQNMATCVICQARTNLMLFELREALCARCLEALRDVDMQSGLFEPDATPQAPQAPRPF